MSTDVTNPALPESKQPEVLAAFLIELSLKVAQIKSSDPAYRPTLRVAVQAITDVLESLSDKRAVRNLYIALCTALREPYDVQGHQSRRDHESGVSFLLSSVRQGTTTMQLSPPKDAAASR